MNTVLNNKILLLLTSFVVAFSGWASTASAQEIDVVYSSNPLFSEADFVPGDAEVRTFTVQNLSADDKNVRLRTIDESDAGLASALAVRIEETGGTVYFDETLSALFGMDYIALGTLASGDSTQFTMSVTFEPAAGNAYQDATAGFALCIGFSGDNENCVTDTDPGGGGGGGGRRTAPDDDDPDLPPGQIAGESTSTTPTLFDNSFTRPFIGLLEGAVLGETTNATSGTSTQLADTEDTPKEGSVAGVALAEGWWGNFNCTFVWLLLLVLISVSWSLIEDRLGKQSGVLGSFFTRNAIFGAVYVVCLLVCLYAGLLEGVWHLFAGAWAVMTGVDYMSHKKVLPEWSARSRNIYFAGTAFVLAIIGFTTSLLCVWVPFVIIALLATLLLFLDR